MAQTVCKTIEEALDALLAEDLQANSTADCTAKRNTDCRAKGTDCRAKGRQNEQLLVDWIYRWGFTSSMTIQRLLSRSAGGAAAHYCRKGLIKETRTASGTPAKFYTLTRAGLELAEYHAAARLPYRELEPYRVNQNQLRHDLLAQSLTLEQLQSGAAVDYLAPRQYSDAMRAPRHRRPDALWIGPDCQRTALEVELSGKWERALDQFFTDAWQSIHAGLFDRVRVVSDSPGLLARYQKHAQAGAVVALWRQNQANLSWHPVDEVRVSERRAARFSYRHLAGPVFPAKPKK